MKLRFHHDGGNEHYHDEDDNDRIYSTAEVNEMLNAPYCAHGESARLMDIWHHSGACMLPEPTPDTTGWFKRWLDSQGPGC